MMNDVKHDNDNEAAALVHISVALMANRLPGRYCYIWTNFIHATESYTITVDAGISPVHMSRSWS